MAPEVKMALYEARVEIKTPEVLSEDTLDRAFDKLVNSRAITDSVLSSDEESAGISYFVDAANARQAIDAGVKELLKVLRCDGEKIVVVEAHPQGDNRNELVSKSEIARRLKRSRERIRQLAKEGKLPPPVQTGEGGRDLYRWGDIERWKNFDSAVAELKRKPIEGSPEWQNNAAAWVRSQRRTKN